MTDNWRPSATLSTLRNRAELLQAVRQFLQERQILEVQTPITTHAGVTDVHIDSISLADDAGYLRTSPEYFHKRLLAAGYGDIYEVGAVFRAGESGRWHSTEFTLLEWYRLGFTYHQLADEVIELLKECSTGQLSDWHVQHMSYSQITKTITGVDFINASLPQLISLTEIHGLPNETERSVLLDFLFSHLIQPQLPDNTITCIVDYPAEQAALARIDTEKPKYCQRFEIFLEQTELANGYQELTDHNELQQRFLQDNKTRKRLNKKLMPLDNHLLNAMQSGLPDCAGVALGIDRWLQKIHQLNQISSTQSFLLS